MFIKHEMVTSVIESQGLSFYFLVMFTKQQLIQHRMSVNSCIGVAGDGSSECTALWRPSLSAADHCHNGFYESFFFGIHVLINVLGTCVPFRS